MSVDDFFDRLDATVTAAWDEVKRGPYWRHVLEHGISADLYRRTLVEIYHYTKHNSVNQAFAAWRVDSELMPLLRFCYEHANEELGHEKMVVHDLDRAGLLTPGLLDQPPLPPTEALIGFLYAVALRDGAVARLGYSFWAETAYDHIGELLAKVRADLGLGDRQMTFFVAHQSIDSKHADDVRHALTRFATDPADQERVVQVARTSLFLTGQMLDAILAEHLAATAPVAV